MALTATATASTRNEICRKLGAKDNDCFSVTSQNKYNIYCVGKTARNGKCLLVLGRGDESEAFVDGANNQSYKDTTHIYLFFKSMLQEAITEPIGYPNVSRFRIVDMFTACTTSGVKDAILNSFKKENGKVRILISTVAFGMGIDCASVRRVIHWGPPANKEEYLQETGHAGRDGKMSYAQIEI